MNPSNPMFRDQPAFCNYCRTVTATNAGDCTICGFSKPHTEEEIKAYESRKRMSNVNHPSHYNTGKIEVIDAIEDWGLGFNTGNAVKYIARAGKKNPEKIIEDLEKAKWYIEREIGRLSEPPASWTPGER